MFGSVTDFKPFGQASGLGRFKGFIELGNAVSVEIIHNQPYHDCLRVSFIEHTLYLHRPIFHCPTLADRNMSFSRKRLNFHKYLSYSISNVFIVYPERATRLAWDWLSYFTNQLFAGLIHAYNRIARGIRKMTDIENILHIRYEGRAAFRRDFPVLAPVGLKFVFFKTRCTDICETESANLSSTALSASNLTVHRRYPCGASEQTKAINLASKAPSNLASRGVFSRTFRASAASSPCRTKRFLRCSIARLLIPSADATSPTFQPGPCSTRKANCWDGVETLQDISVLKALERERNNLISAVAHDMKSSLTIIGGFVLRLIHKAENLDRVKEQRYLEIIRDESGKFDNMITNFLEFARIQTGRLKLNLAAISLDKELIELCEAY